MRQLLERTFFHIASLRDLIAVAAVIVYLTAGALYVIFLVSYNREQLFANQETLNQLKGRKEYHILISEDNNAKLQEIIDLLKKERCGEE
jgi:hypothetical protein